MDSLLGSAVTTSDVNKDLTCKGKAKAKAKDLSFKAKAKAKDTKIVLK